MSAVTPGRRRQVVGKTLLVAIPMAASIGGMGTIIGSPPNAIAVGVAADFGREVNFVEWMLPGPVVIVAWVMLISSILKLTGLS